MTVNELQVQLINEIGRLTQDMSLVDRYGRPASLKGYAQAVPVFDAVQDVPVFGDSEAADPPAIGEDSLFPYFIVRMDGVEYQKEQTDGENQAHVLIAFAIYDEDPGMRGYFTLSAVMERVAMRFQGDTVLGPFYCKRQMSTAYQDDDTYPQFFGAMEMTWILPDAGFCNTMGEW